MYRTVLVLVTAAAVLAMVGVNLVPAAAPRPIADVAGARSESNAPSPDSNATRPECAPRWVTAWNASPIAAPGGAVPARPEVGSRTLRMIVHPRAAGPEIRLVLSNRYGAEPLELRSVTVGLAGVGPALAGAPIPVTFGGLATARGPAREELSSDPVPLSVTPANGLAVSMFVPGPPDVVSEHPSAMRTSYLSDPGDHAGSVEGAEFGHPVDSWLVLTGVDVRAQRATNAVLLMGDSITDGVGSSPNTDRRLSDSLGDRLSALGGPDTMSVLNAGIAGNRLLADLPTEGGDAALTRFDREVAGRPGVTDVILHDGTNDVAAGVGARDVIDGMVRFTERAHGAGLRVFLTTLTPAQSGPHGTPGAVTVREEINQWVRTQGRSHADGVFDFAAAVTDVSQPNRLANGLDSGDGLHLSDVGYQALAGAVDLAALSGSRCLA